MHLILHLLLLLLRVGLLLLQTLLELPLFLFQALLRVFAGLPDLRILMALALEADDLLRVVESAFNTI